MQCDRLDNLKKANEGRGHGGLLVAVKNSRQPGADFDAHSIINIVHRPSR